MARRMTAVRAAVLARMNGEAIPDLGTVRSAQVAGLFEKRKKRKKASPVQIAEPEAVAESVVDRGGDQSELFDPQLEASVDPEDLEANGQDFDDVDDPNAPDAHCVIITDQRVKPGKKPIHRLTRNQIRHLVAGRTDEQIGYELRRLLHVANREVFDLAKLLELKMAGCTHAEIAAEFGVTEKCIEKHRADDEVFNRIYELGEDRGVAALRKAQFKKAVQGDVAMLIWLGKNRLNQRDKIDNTHSGNVIFRLHVDEKSAKF